LEPVCVFVRTLQYCTASTNINLRP